MNQMNTGGNWLRRAASWIANHELWLLLLVIPLVFALPFILPSYGYALITLVIVGIWSAKWITYGWLVPPNPLNAPMLAILLLAIVGYQVAVDHYFFNKLWLSDTILRVVVFYAIVNSLRTKQAIIKFATILLILFAALAILLFVGTNWADQRLLNIFSLYDYLPRFLGDLSALTTGQVPEGSIQAGSVYVGLQPRFTGDLISTLLPFAGALLLFAQGRTIRIPAALSLITGLAVLILSQDLPGLLGFLAGTGFAILWWRPRFFLPIMLLAAVVLTGLVYNNRIALASALLDINDLAGIAVVLRLDMWSRALAMIGDMPFSGIGLGTFNLIQSYFYTGHSIGPEFLAHQWFLQTALDTGWPGLLAFLWLGLALVLTSKRAYQMTHDKNLQVLLTAVLASFISLVIGGLTGAHTAPALLIGWSPYALAAAILVVAERHAPQQQDSVLWNLITGWRLLIPFAILIIVALLLFPVARDRNLGLVQAHKAIYTVIESGELPVEQAARATTFLTGSLDHEPARAQLYGTRASLYAWQGDQEAALADLERRVDLDLRDPYGAYAPFLAWKGQVDDEPLPDQAHQLEQVYHQWSTRFKQRAEFHVLYAMAMERVDGDPGRAIARIQLGLEEGAQPRALLEAYLQQLQKENGRSVVDY